jgi:XTP/dITP diphosphohydrolase
VSQSPEKLNRVLVLATLNRAKARELTELLGDVGYEVRPLADWPAAALPEETEGTYAGNALLKARAAIRITDCLVLADDSGLEVDALDGAPGLRSARFGGPGLDDAGRLWRLLEALRDVPAERRTARFRCAIALLVPGGGARFTAGVVEGVIADSPRGTGGFGYDPVFFYPPLGRTLAELSPEEKARVSHRAVAVAAARRLLVGDS